MLVRLVRCDCYSSGRAFGVIFFSLRYSPDSARQNLYGFERRSMGFFVFVYMQSSVVRDKVYE